MSRKFDAKHEALAAYPDKRAKGVELFLMALNVSADDFAYEEAMSPEEYIYGKTSHQPIKGITQDDR